uniref:Uncharacterized protein n=1 Tax=Rangifer tarandus platyrhynchus TaxID=3082113 RepID=A0ACB0E0U6_RANTA|nr:unnamed protein product [Rangifer tarandus platyrhynchus]
MEAAGRACAHGLPAHDEVARRPVGPSPAPRPPPAQGRSSRRLRARRPGRGGRGEGPWGRGTYQVSRRPPRHPPGPFLERAGHVGGGGCPLCSLDSRGALPDSGPYLGLCPQESPYSGVAAYRPLDCNGPGRRLTPSAVFHLFLLGLVILERAVGIWQLYRQKVVKEVLFSLSVMGTPQKDVIIKSDAPDILLLEKHADYIASYGSKKDDYEYCMSEYLRMSGIYWGLTVMDLMGQLHHMNRDEILTFIKSCQHECGGISASIGHDPHLLYTLSAVQILTLYDSINVIDINKVVEYVQSLQKEDGSFAGDIWGPTKQLV